MGWTEGENIAIEIRWGRAGNPELIEEYARELVRWKPDLIFANNLHSGNEGIEARYNNNPDSISCGCPF